MCDNILELLPYMYAIYTMQELIADPDYDIVANQTWLERNAGWVFIVASLFAIALCAVAVILPPAWSTFAGLLFGFGTGFLSAAGASFIAQGVSNNWKIKAIDPLKLLISGGIGAAIGLISGMFSTIAGSFMEYYGSWYGNLLAKMTVDGRSIGSLFAYLGGAKTIASVLGFTAKTIGALAGGMIANEVANYSFGYDPTMEENTTEGGNGLLLDWLHSILQRVFKWIKK